MSEVVFSRADERLGDFALRPVDPSADAKLLHGWVTHPKSAFWLMQDHDVAAVEREYEEIVDSPYYEAFVGLHEGQPSFLVERYDPANVELKGLYAHRDGDVGMHFLCAPTDAPLHGFSLAVITTVMELLFDDPTARRVVVEPDATNGAVHALNEAVGFQVVGVVQKPEKKALLFTCTREQFFAAREGDR